MSVTITVAALSTRMTKLATLKSDLNLDQADESNDQHLEEMIDRASAAIESHCRRVFAKETIKETLASRGRAKLLLSRTPILTVTTLKFDGAAVTDFEIDDAGAGILYRVGGFTSTEVLYGGTIEPTIVPGAGRRVWEAVYDAGYVMPEDEEGAALTRTLPHDLEDACLLTIKGRYLSLTRDPSIISERIGDFWAATYGGRGLPDPVRELLIPWVREA